MYIDHRIVNIIVKTLYVDLHVCYVFGHTACFKLWLLTKNMWLFFIGQDMSLLKIWFELFTTIHIYFIVKFSYSMNGLKIYCDSYDTSTSIVAS